jgi:hypothetical protein
MAAIDPTDIFASYAADSTAVTIPLAALPGLTAAEAHPTEGDAREVLRIILETYVSKIEQMQPANRPVYMTAQRGNLIGLSPSLVSRTYTITFHESVGATATSVRPEPA